MYIFINIYFLYIVRRKCISAQNLATLTVDDNSDEALNNGVTVLRNLILALTAVNIFLIITCIQLYKKKRISWEYN